MYIKDHLKQTDMRYRIVLCIVSLLVLVREPARSQIPGILDKGKRLLDQLSLFEQSLTRFMASTSRTTEEFNRTVTVIKGDTRTTSGGNPPANITSLKIKKGEIKNLRWAPVAYFDNQLFPSAILSMATYRGETTPELQGISRPLGIRILGKENGVEIKWEIECSEKKYFDKVAGSIIYDQAGREILINPPISWNVEALAKQMTSTPINITYRLFNGDGDKVEQVMPLTLRSINDCILAYKSTMMFFMFTAYVQEQHPEIDKILREALNTKMVNSFLGYQMEDHEVSDTFTYVDRQVAAIWRVLHDRGFAYSDVTETIGDKGDVSSQSVRTFDKAIRSSQANCIDGVVVLASIMKQIGLHTYIIKVPGHAFLAYTIDSQGMKFRYLETTMLSASGNLEAAKTSNQKTIVYIQLFKDAIKVASKEFADAQQEGKSLIIDISNERKKVQPLPVYNEL